MRTILVAALILIGLSSSARAGARKLTGPPGERSALPDEHPYQKTLRKFLSTLSEKDSAHRHLGRPAPRRTPNQGECRQSGAREV
jgi:hypothetical protein